MGSGNAQVGAGGGGSPASAVGSGGGSPADAVGPGGGSPPDAVGSAGEEAVKLFAALTDWASAQTASASRHLATGAAECTLCPVCQAIRVARQARPELLGHLGDAMGSLVAALRAVVEANERQRAAARSAPVEHIDIG
jgi:hypothetical protein